MSIIGGIKFFDASKCLFKNGASAVASSASDSANFILSTNKYIRWDSVESDDATTETITITFDSAQINRLFLVDHNFKSYTITYGSTPTDFINVTGLTGSISGIVETDYNLDTSYYEFDSVNTTQINITVTTTQVVDAQKYLNIFVVSKEVGTFEGYPNVTPSLNSNEKIAKTVTGKYVTQKNFEIFSCDISLEHTSQNDIDIISSVYDDQSPFLIWLCGGKYGTSNFSVALKNWRLKDLYQVQIAGEIETIFRNNIYTSSPILSFSVVEEV